MALLPCSFPVLQGGLWTGFSTSRVSIGGGGGGLRVMRYRPSLCSTPKWGAKSALWISARAETRASLASQEQAEDRTENAGSSFLRMWERAQRRRHADGQGGSNFSDTSSSAVESKAEDWGAREKNFQKILEAPAEERDRIQRRQIVDRAAAALAAANAFLAQYPATSRNDSGVPGNAFRLPIQSSSGSKVVPVSAVEVRRPQLSWTRGGDAGTPGFTPATNSTFESTPGPDFWSWVPEPLGAESITPRQAFQPAGPELKQVKKDGPRSALPWADVEGKENEDFPLVFQSRAMPSLPPFQSLLEIEKESLAETEQERTVAPLIRMPEADTQTASAVNEKQRGNESSTSGVHEDGSRWWQETGVELREKGIVCNWTVIRGVSADQVTEWEEKFWEASDAFDYKELGAEKSGRDSFGRVWHEFWKEAMWQDLSNGLQHIEKTADKWAQDGIGGQWHEKWYEHYDASGRAEKWADKWSQIDPATPLEPGHAHAWHERWGETYDGQGGTMKYTDKWAERQEESGSWTKWGDKWDEHFDSSGQGVKQGETWWQGSSGEKWNRTWGEGHNGSGWVHKYGMSSSGEHWDTHEEENTWYNSRPHFGFRECYDNSGELRRVGERKRRQL